MIQRFRSIHRGYQEFVEVHRRTWLFKFSMNFAKILRNSPTFLHFSPNLKKKATSDTAARTKVFKRISKRSNLNAQMSLISKRTSSTENVRRFSSLTRNFLNGTTVSKSPYLFISILLARSSTQLNSTKVFKSKFSKLLDGS